MDKAAEILSPWVDVPEVDTWQPWRLDLAWNYDLPVRQLVLAHHPLRVPGIRKAPTLFDDGAEVAWRGSRSRFVVRFYDKCREMRVEGSVLRAEVQLAGAELRARLVGQDWNDFDSLWRMYREILATVPSIEAGHCKNWREAIALEPLEVRERIMARLSGRTSPRTFRRWRREMESAAAGLSETFSWGTFLPAGNPPVPVNVEPRRRPTVPMRCAASGSPLAFAG